MGGTRRVDTDEVGERLTAADKDSKRLLIEERLAKQNGLRISDEITLAGNEEKTTAR
ncbi:hypothetical protein ABZ869_27675 [Streptomyces sp. NPDC046928]|uniref:hypothetical protein n=1 Tax=Streptomyces sp. NPDC046928 TaxID=3155021 RepID=UPI0034099F4A